MGRHDPFSVAIISALCPQDNQTIQQVLEQLQATETQAIKLVQLFRDGHYLPVQVLRQKLEEQRLPAVDLKTLAAFLVGYLSAENFRSRFDTTLFGETSIGDDKGTIASTSLVALLNLIAEQNMTVLPNRVPPGEPILMDEGIDHNEDDLDEPDDSDNDDDLSNQEDNGAQQQSVV